MSLMWCIWFGFKAATSSAPFVSSTDEKINALKTVILKIVSEQHKNTYRLLEVGSGDGRVTKAISHTLTSEKKNHTIDGFELMPHLVLASLLSLDKAEKDKIKFFPGKFESRSFAGYDIIYFYLLPKTVSMAILKAFSENENREVFVVSLNFESSDPKHIPITIFDAKKAGKVFVYSNKPSEKLEILK